MTDLTMNDFVHAAVRRDLARTEQALRAFRDGDASRARALRRAWETLWRQLHHHHTGEDTHIWPWLRTIHVLPEQLLDSMELEHRDMAAAMQEATDGLEALVVSPTSEVAQVAADAVARAAEVTDRHLLHEETAVVPALAEHFETPEWKVIEKQLKKSSPAFAGELFAWLLDGTRPEIADGIRATVPGPVLFVLTRVFGRRYAREVAPVWR